MRKIVWIIMCMLTVMAGSSALGAFSERVITATGEGETHDEALKRAMRSAIERGVGVLIDSETLIEKNQLISDKVFAEVKGYINSYDILEKTDEEGLHTVKIKAVVSLKRLRKNLKGLNIVLAEKENPRVMVSIKEYVDGAALPAPVITPLFERKLRRSKIELVDRAQLEMIKKREAALNYDDPMAAAALGRQFGVELLILGEASAELASELEAYGTKAYVYNANMNIKAVVTDTAEIIFSGSSSGSETGGGGTRGKTTVGRDALEKAAEKIADKTIAEVLEKWRSEVFNVAMIKITAVAPDQEELDNFKTEVAALEGVEQIIERESFKGTSMYDVLIQSAVKKDFATKLLRIEGVVIKGKTANTIRLNIEPVDVEEKIEVEEEEIEEETEAEE